MAACKSGVQRPRTSRTAGKETVRRIFARFAVSLRHAKRTNCTARHGGSRASFDFFANCASRPRLGPSSGMRYRDVGADVGKACVQFVLKVFSSARFTEYCKQ